MSFEEIVAPLFIGPLVLDLCHTIALLPFSAICFDESTHIEMDYYQFKELNKAMRLCLYEYFDKYPLKRAFQIIRGLDKDPKAMTYYYPTDRGFPAENSQEIRPLIIKITNAFLDESPSEENLAILIAPHKPREDLK